MKKPFNPVIPDYTPKGQKKAEEQTVPARFCLICNKPTAGYGPWANGFTCSRDCEVLQQAKPKEYPDDPQRNRTVAG